MTLVPKIARTLLAAILRITVIFVVLVIAWDASVRAVTQLAPASLWFTFTRVTILPSGNVAIAYRESRAGDLPVTVITELIGVDGSQPCASSGRRVIEKETSFAIIPLVRVLPACDFSGLLDGPYKLQISASYPAIGAFDKMITVVSENEILVEGGAIVGATPMPLTEVQ